MNLKHKLWTPEEDEWLIQNFPIHGKPYCAQHLNRTVNSIAGRVVKLNLVYVGLSANCIEGYLVCIQCKTEKLIDEFYVNKDRKTGVRGECKDCSYLNNKTYRTENDVDLKKRKKIYYDANREKIVKAGYQRKKKKYHSDPTFKLMNLIRNRFRWAIHRMSFTKNREQIIGCSSDELRYHIELQFSDNMSWETYKQKFWQVDHIIPVSILINHPDKLYLIFNYRNYQPLLTRDNKTKHNHLQISKEHLLRKIEKFGTDEVYEEMLEFVNLLLNEKQ